MLQLCQLSMRNRALFLMPFFLLINDLISQSDLSFSKTITNPNNSWETYIDKDNILIEYCFQEDKPTRTYKGEYLVFKITNKSSQNKVVSWDFSAAFNSEKCLNCNSDQEEFHVQKTLKPMSFIKGDITSIIKGPLVIFFRFKDERYQNKKNSTWESFELKNLMIK